MAPTTRSKQVSPEPTASTSALDTSNSDEARIMRNRSASRTRQEELVDPNYAIDLANQQTENVYLFLPNIIGYIRVITAGISLYLLPHAPKLCTCIYFISCILDVFDGMAARALGQESKFGAVLDMVTDRCATACLLCFLAMTYNDWSLLIMFLITLDFSSHYIHMYSTLATGSVSHKKVTSDVSRILWLYYNNKYVLFAFCFFNEVFFVCAYLNYYERTPIYDSVIMQYLSYVFDFKAAASILPSAIVAVFNYLGSVSWAQMIGALTLPIMTGKQIINVVQFWKASKILVGVDLAERQAKRQTQAQADRLRSQ